MQAWYQLSFPENLGTKQTVRGLFQATSPRPQVGVASLKKPELSCVLLLVAS